VLGLRLGAADRAYVAGVLAGALVLVGLGLASVLVDPAPRNDFAEDHLGFQLLVSGRDPYDPTVWPAALATVGRTAVTSAFVLPPYDVVLYLPFALLPLRTAWVLWTIAGPALAGLALGMLLRRLDVPAVARFLIGLMLMTSEGSIAAVARGQQDFFLTAALAAAVAWLASSDQVAGALATLGLAAKPHLFLLAGWSLLARVLTGRQRRAVAILLMGLVAVLASTAAAPRVWSEWAATFAPFAATPPRLTATLDVSLASVLGQGGHVVAAILLVALVLLMLRIAPTGAHPGWLALSIVAAPYAQRHDHVMLVVPIAIAVASAARVSVSRATMTAAAGALVLGPVAALLLVAGGFPAADPYGGLVPLLIFALVLAPSPVVTGATRGTR
jgi:glycosyl transferase family 87